MSKDACASTGPSRNATGAGSPSTKVDADATDAAIAARSSGRLSHPVSSSPSSVAGPMSPFASPIRTP